MPETIFDKNYNLVNLYQDNHTLVLGPNKSPDIILGVGYDINDINYPIAKGLFFKDITEVTDVANLEYDSDPQSYTFTISKAETIEQERTAFSLNFSGSYGVVSGSASYEETKTYFEKSNIFYLEFLANTGAKTIQDITNIKWINKPIAEDIIDNKERFKQFFADQGSHFVRTIYYGSRIVVRAKTNSKDEAFSQKVNAAIKAIGSTFKEGAELNYEHQETLQSTNLDISISVLGKLKSPTDQNKNPIFQAVSYEYLMKLIEQIRNGETKLISCPIKCELETYRYRLTTLPNCKKIYSSLFMSTPAESPFGVPSGTIIAWIPKLSDCSLDDTGKVLEIIPPNGWIICNSNSEYNLDGKFLRGTNLYEEVKSIGGEESHKHIVNGNTNGYSRAGNMAAGLDGGDDDLQHFHSFSTTSESSSNIPPYFKVIYLIKI